MESYRVELSRKKEDLEENEWMKRRERKFPREKKVMFHNSFSPLYLCCTSVPFHSMQSDMLTFSMKKKGCEHQAHKHFVNPSLACRTVFF